jgi:hypothetical protein
VNLGFINKDKVIFWKIMIRINDIFDKAKAGLVKSTNKFQVLHLYGRKKIDV